MSIFFHGETGNKQDLGKYFLKKAIGFALDGKFNISAEFIKEGLSFLSCDCEIGNWKDSYNISNKTILDDVLINKAQSIQYLFVKAFIYSFEKEKKELYVALDSIEKYLKYAKTKVETGFINEYILSEDDIYFINLIKIKILIGLGEYEKAYGYLGWIKSSYCAYYFYMGILSSKLSNYNELEFFYNSFCNNPYSACCIQKLRESFIRRNFELEKNPYDQNVLIKLFLDSDLNNDFFQRFQKLNRVLKFDIDNILKGIDNNTNELKEFIEYINLYDSRFSKLNQANIYDDLPEMDELDSYGWGQENYYNEDLDIDQQSQEYWDNL